MTQQTYFRVFIHKNWNQDLEAVSAAHVHCSIIHNSQDMETTEVSINGWVEKEEAAYIYNGILFSLKKKEILSHAIIWMNLEDIMLGEISQSQKHKSKYMRYLK